MADAERDSTQDWLVPEAARPVTMLELQQRVDVALAVARSAEAAALEIGAAAFDAAEQAHRAADLAERAAGVAGGAGPVGSGAEAAGAANGAEPAAAADGASRPDDSLQKFSHRADRVMDRLRALEPVA